MILDIWPISLKKKNFTQYIDGKQDGYFHNNGCYVSKLHANSVFSIRFVQQMRAPSFHRRRYFTSV